MMERGKQVQATVIGALEPALSPLTVTAGPSLSVGARYVRVDSFLLRDDDQYRNAETSTHEFVVHVFDAPEGGTRSLSWAWDTLAAVDSVLTGLTVSGGTVRRQEAQCLFEPKATEGVFDAHGFIRYRVQIGA